MSISTNVTESQRTVEKCGIRSVAMGLAKTTMMNAHKAVKPGYIRLQFYAVNTEHFNNNVETYIKYTTLFVIHVNIQMSLLAPYTLEWHRQAEFNIILQFATAKNRINR